MGLTNENSCLNLSYPIAAGMPLYPGTPEIGVEKDKSIDSGDSCNTFVVCFSNHSGTHVDMPRHFIPTGRSVCDYDLNELIFYHPFILDCPKSPGEIIETEDIEKETIPIETDFLIFKTGFSKYRQDIDTYTYKNPCISPDAATWIRNSHADIKGVGVDFLSVSSKANPDLGKKTHQILLGNGGFKSDPLIIVEDMAIPLFKIVLDQVILSPIYIENVDSAPCTVIGVLKD